MEEPCRGSLLRKSSLLYPEDVLVQSSQPLAPLRIGSNVCSIPAAPRLPV